MSLCIIYKLLTCYIPDNAIDVAYTIPRYEAPGAAGVVMEDNTFPEDSSLRLSINLRQLPNYNSGTPSRWSSRISLDSIILW
jgi:hypothetical protein